VLFAPVCAGGHAAIGQPIATLFAEHDEHGVHPRELARLTADFTVPDDVVRHGARAVSAHEGSPMT
jgi:iron-sulfur cluster repair protein YtfE (RIC family)